MSDPRTKILASAVELYLTDGLDGFSMRRLAKDVGVTAPAIYRHYDGREAVLADVLREAHRVFSRYLYDALGAPTPYERFSRAGEGFLNFVIEHPRWYEIMHTSLDNLGMEQLPADIEAMQAAIQQFWNDRVRECMQAGVLKEGDQEEASLTMWAHAHGLVQLYRQGCVPVSEDVFREVFRRSTARLMAGVATDEFAVELEKEMQEEVLGTGP